MKSFVGLFLLFASLCVINCNPVEELDEVVDLADGVRANEPTTVIHESNMPTVAETELLDVIRSVHNNYLSNILKAEAVSGGFSYRSYYCAWNVIIYPITVTNIAIWPALPKTGYAKVLVDASMFYYVFSCPKQSRKCEF